MKTKGKLLTILAAIVFAFSIVTIVACNDVKHEHTYGAWEIVEDPTETTEGKAARTCSDNDSTEEIILKVLTDITFWTVSKTPASHTEEGATVYTAKDHADIVYSVPIPKTEEHDFGDWTVDPDNTPTETEAGKFIRTCKADDGASETENVPALSDDTFWTVKSSTPAGHEIEGSTVYSCEFGDVTVIIPAEEHFYGVWEIDPDHLPTKVLTGKATRSCTADDGASITKNVPVLTDSSVWRLKSSTPADHENDGSEVYVSEYGTVEVTIHTQGHNYGDWTVETEPTVTAGGKLIRTCLDDGDVDERDLPMLSDATYWDVDELPQSYNSAHTYVYTAKDDDTMTFNVVDVDNPKLVAPYDNKTYFTIEFASRLSGVTHNSMQVTARQSATLTLDSNGEGTASGYPLRVSNKFVMTEASAGSIKWINIDGTNKTSEHSGYVDMQTGLMIVEKASGSFDDIYLFSCFPSLKAVASSWLVDTDRIIAITGSYTDDGGSERQFGISIVNSEVTFGVTFKNLTDTVLEADACHNAEQVYAYKNNERIEGFAYGFDGSKMCVLYGNEGVYTADGYSDKFVISGFGTVKLGDATGSYTAAEDGKLNVIIENDFYLLTLDKENSTCTVETPKVTVRFDVNGGNEIADAQFTPYIISELPTPTNSDATKLFKGWYYDGEFDEKVTEFIPELSENGFTLYARWGVKITVGIHSDIEFDGYNPSLEITTGDVYTDLLPDLNGIYKDGYKFIDWYVDEEMNVALPEGAEASAADDGNLTLYAKWDIAGLWNLQNAGTYGFVYDSNKGAWKSTNQGKGSTSSIMELFVVEGTLNVTFEYAASSEAEAKWDYLNVEYYDVSYGGYRSIGTAGGNKTYDQMTWKSYSNDFVEGYKVRFTYIKDNGTNTGEDTGYIRNLTINGMLVTTLGSVDFMGGTYTCTDNDELVLDGKGSFTWGDKAGTYAKQSDTELFDMYVVSESKNTEYYELALDTVQMTYSADKIVVTVTLDYGVTGEASVNNEVNKNIVQTLTEKTVSGFVFRGWYDNAEFDGSAITSVTPSADMTVYAKYDRAVTLIYNHMVSGTDDHSVSVFENNKVDTLYEMPESVTNGDKIFVGWFTKDGTDGDWGEQVTKDTVVAGPSDAVMTVYAQWVAPHALMGTYLGYEFDSTSLSTTLRTLTIDAFGNYNGSFLYSATSVSKGKVTYDETLNIGQFNTKYFYYDETSDTIVTNYGESASTSLGNDVLVFVKVDNSDVEMSVDSSEYVTWDSNKSKLGNITVGGNKKYYFVYDSKIYVDVTHSVIDSENKSITDMSKYKTNGNKLTITLGLLTWKFVYANNTFNFSDGSEGTYTCDGEENVVLDGAGGIAYDGKTGTLTATDGGYIAQFVDATYILTIDVTAKTYTMVEDKVSISYDFGTTGGSLESADVYRNISFTIPEAPDIDGYIFRGWYENAEFTGSALTRITPDSDTVVYAKYDKAITVTIVYGNGMENGVVDGKFANDKVTVALPDTANGLYAEGWYTDAAFTTAWTSGSAVTDDITLYCKWVEPVAMFGEYKLYNIFGNTNATVKSSGIKVDYAGNFSGTFTGKLDGYDEQTGFGAVKNGNSLRYIYFDSNLKAFVSNDSSTANGAFTNDIDFGIQASSLTVSASDCITLDSSNITRLVKYTADDEVGYILIGKNIVVFAKSVAVVDKDGNAVETLSGYKTAGNVFTFTRNDDTAVIGTYDGAKLLISDGTTGTYANAAMFGDITLDGYGNLEIGKGEIAYTVTADGNVRIVYGSRMYILSLDKENGTYAQVQDGYAGTYTLPDDAGTITFNGLGGAGNGKTYVVNGAQVIVYDGDTSANYGLDVENKELLGKSAVAGMVFEQQGSTSRTVTFDDGTDPTGVFYGGYAMNITFGSGRMDGNKIVLTVTAQVGNYCAVGDTFVFEYNAEAGTLTFKLSESGVHSSGSLSIDEYGLTEGKVFNARA